MLCVMFLWNLPTGFRAEYFKISSMYFHYFVILSLGNGSGPLFEQTWLPFTHGCFLPSLVEIGPYWFWRRRFLLFPRSGSGELSQSSSDSLNWDRFFGERCNPWTSIFHMYMYIILGLSLNYEKYWKHKVICEKPVLLIRLQVSRSHLALSEYFMNDLTIFKWRVENKFNFWASCDKDYHEIIPI